MPPFQVEILCFDGFDELDAIGPYEVFANGALAGAPLETRLVTLEPTETVTASHGLRVEPDGVLGDPDLLVVPGGGWTGEESGVSAVVDDGRLPEAVRARYETGTTVASVCTGAMVLAAAGLLEGRPATTHRVARKDLESVATMVEARVVDARVDDGSRILTAGGVTSGLDLALWVLETDFESEISEWVTEEMAYEFEPAAVAQYDGLEALGSD